MAGTISSDAGAQAAGHGARGSRRRSPSTWRAASAGTSAVMIDTAAIPYGSWKKAKAVT